MRQHSLALLPERTGHEFAPGFVHSLIELMRNSALRSAPVIHWSSPVPVFGDLRTALIASVGINPSNREFTDTEGRELCDDSRRFHTLKSLRLKSWSSATPSDALEIWRSCCDYFQNSPYMAWFGQLEQLFAATRASYRNGGACHLDLVPYATSRKWTELTRSERDALTQAASPLLGEIMAASYVKVVILNGHSVVEHFERSAETRLRIERIKDWDLPRLGGRCVPGKSYYGHISKYAGVALRQRIIVLGYNHNIQSSFGVSATVRSAIASWITRILRREGILQ